MRRRVGAQIVFLPLGGAHVFGTLCGPHLHTETDLFERAFRISKSVREIVLPRHEDTDDRPRECAEQRAAGGTECESGQGTEEGEQ